jgi:predicted molibdopterin-dependent oxidoreductase YjgC
LIGTELLVIFGAGLAKDQPVITKYLHFAKKAGTRILAVSPTRESDLERYWAPPLASGALFGAKLMDEFYQVADGGNVAFINGVIKSLIASGRIDKSYVDKHTAGFAELKAALDQQTWPMLEKSSGVPRGQIQRFADLYGQAKSAVLVSSVEVTQQESGVDDAKAIANLALARGMLGRKKCGIMPIGGGSGGQGGSECGAEPDKFPGGFAVNDDNARRFSNLWYHPVPSSPGLKLPQMIEAAQRGEINFLYSIGSNLLEPMADANFVGDALRKIALRVHQGIALDTSMLHDADEAVVLLPAQTRYEQRSGGITSSSERRIRFTPEIPGHRIGECLPQWEIPVLIGQMSMPNGSKLFPFADTQAIREEMSRVMPMFQGIEKLNKEGDQWQWGGPFLFKDGFTAMPDNRALFTVLMPN